MTGPRLGIVCGMEAEARALGRWRRDPRIAVATSAGRPGRAEAEARRLVEQGVRALLSWGIAGALDPALSPGALIVADRIIAPDGRASPAAIPPLPGIETGRIDPLWWGRDRAGAPLPPLHVPILAPLAGSDAVLLDPAAKAALRARTGAAAVDMESHRVAAVAAEAGLPCFALRAISDPAGRALPRLAATALDAQGRPRVGAVLAGLACRPGDLPALVAAARDSRAALAALSGAADAVIGALLAR